MLCLLLLMVFSYLLLLLMLYRPTLVSRSGRLATLWLVPSFTTSVYVTGHRSNTLDNQCGATTADSSVSVPRYLCKYKIPIFISVKTYQILKVLQSSLIILKKAKIGAKLNKITSTLLGKIVSLTNIFNLSARGCSKPKVPIKLGPLRAEEGTQLETAQLLVEVKLY